MNESLDSRQLNAFVTLAKTGSHAAAAKQLHLTNSAVSHSIHALEEQVGCRLFCKLGKKGMLTEAGEALLHHAERALSEMRQARGTIAELNKWGFRRLRLAVEIVFHHDLLAPIILEFHKAFPGTVIHVETCSAGRAAELLGNGTVDVVLGAKPVGSGDLEFRPLFADCFHLVAGPTHPLAAATHPSRTDLSGLPCILLRGCGHDRETLEGLLLQRDVRLSIAGEIEEVGTVKSLIRQTQLLGLLPAWVIARELQDRSLVSLTFGKKRIEQTWGLIHAAGRSPRLAEAALWAVCGQAIAKLG
ncbi:MAG: LysR family transcriptional regulator [Verrucomicrobiota bacterium]